MRTGIKCLLLMAGLLLPFWGALGEKAPKPLVLTARDHGRTVSVPVGQQLTVDLQLKEGRQVVTPEYDPQVLALLGQSLQSAFGPQGASSRVVYQFVVLKAGATDLVISAKTSNTPDQGEPLLKVRIVARGGEMI